MPPKRRGVQVSAWSVILICAVAGLITFQVVWQQRMGHVVAGVDTDSRRNTINRLLAVSHEVPSAAAAAASPTGDSCHMEQHNEYHGAVVVWGEKNLKDTAEGCCKQCQETARCNAWVYCPVPQGCGSGRSHKECWLKEAPMQELFENVIGKAHGGIPWTSGAKYSQREYDMYQQKVRDKVTQEEDRRRRLHDDEELPLVFLDVSIDAGDEERIEMVLFMKESPLAAENMRVFCTGEKGEKHRLRGAYFYRIIDRFIDQTGVEVDSIYGGQFKDDAGGLKLQHDRPYLLSIANGGPNTNTAHFSITVAPAHHLDGHYVIFGECVSGFAMIERINALSRGQPNNELLHSWRVKIVNTGQLRRGSYRPPPTSP